MVTRQERQMLSRLCEFTGYTESRFARYEGSCEVFLIDDPSRKVDLSMYSKEIEGLLYLLETEGYMACNASGTESRLTPKGLHYEYVRWTEFKNFLLTSVFTPIAVSAITTIVTLWITTLLQ